MPDAQETVLEALRTLLRRRDDGHIAVGLESDIFDDLGLDSLEVAEFSAMLEDDLGTDPYSAGIVPRTAAEVVSFYGS